MKICSKCKAEKPLVEFHKDKHKKDGLCSSCKSCGKIYSSENSLKISEYKREYAKINSDRRKKYVNDNREKIALRSKKYQQDNPEKISARNRNRHAMKRMASGKHTAAEIMKIFDSQRGLCASCEIKLFKSGKNKYHVDHITPLKLGGANDKYNLQCLCPKCNCSKSAEDPVIWANKNGRLL